MKNLNLKKIFIMLTVLLLVTGFVFAQAEAETEEGGIINLKMEQFSGTDSNASGPALKAMIAAFEKENPNIKVSLQTIGYNDYFTQLQSKVVGGNAADLFELNFENFVSYASEDTLASLEGRLSDVSGFNQTALNAFRYEGSQYGIPDSFSTVMLIYNKDLFDKASVAYPTDDWTWDDMEAAGKKIRALGDDIFGLYRPLTFHEFYKAAGQNSSSLMTSDYKEFTIDTPVNVKIAERMASWQIDSNIMPTEAQMGGMGDWDLFKSGRLGMVITGIWAFSDFTANCDFPWDVAIEPGNTQKSCHFFSNAYVVSETSKHQDAAIKLAEFLAGSKEATALRVEAAWELPPVTYTDVLEAYLKITPPDNRQSVFDSLNYVVTPPVVKQQAEMQDIISGYLEQIVYEKMDAASALAECQEELEKKIIL